MVDVRQGCDEVMSTVRTISSRLSLSASKQKYRSGLFVNLLRCHVLRSHGA